LSDAENETASWKLAVPKLYRANNACTCRIFAPRLAAGIAKIAAQIQFEELGKRCHFPILKDWNTKNGIVFAYRQVSRPAAASGKF
jgi:hypothetical protein